MNSKKIWEKTNEMLWWFEENEFQIDEHDMGWIHARKNNRRYRVLVEQNLFQVCDCKFDRWANSVGNETRLPKNESQFSKMCEKLLQ